MADEVERAAGEPQAIEIGSRWQDADPRHTDRFVVIAGLYRAKVAYRNEATNRLAVSAEARFRHAFKPALVARSKSTLPKPLEDRLRGLEAKDGIRRTRYLLGPWEDPSDGPKCLMSLEAAVADLRERFLNHDDTQLGDELTYRVIELSDAEVESVPEF